jgi:excinuclease ABC subunit C
VALFRVNEGAISQPVVFPISAAEHTKSQSMEARVEEALCAAAHPARADSADDKGAGKNARPTLLELMEHLAILKRWYYRGTRTGEIFFADAQGALPMRRVVRGIGRVYKGEAPESS